jgi:hypothetical protein
MEDDDIATSTRPAYPFSIDGIGGGLFGERIKPFFINILFFVTFSWATAGFVWLMGKIFDTDKTRFVLFVGIVSAILLILLVFVYYKWFRTDELVSELAELTERYRRLSIALEWGPSLPPPNVGSV